MPENANAETDEQLGAAAEALVRQSYDEAVVEVEQAVAEVGEDAAFEEALMDAFKAFDLDGDGELDALELGELLELVGRPRADGLSVMPSGEGKCNFEQFVALFCEGLDEEEEVVVEGEK